MILPLLTAVCYFIDHISPSPYKAFDIEAIESRSNLNKMSASAIFGMAMGIGCRIAANRMMLSRSFAGLTDFGVR